MAFKSFLFFSCLLLAAMAAPLAQAQLFGGLGGLLSLIKISGTLFCTANGNMGINGAATPVFPNAKIQLRCGTDKSVIASSTTSSGGVFSILLDPLSFLLSSVLNDCNLVINTPLTSCNVSLPTGTLQSPLQLIGKTVQGLLSVVNIVPGGFSLLPLTS